MPILHIPTWDKYVLSLFYSSSFSFKYIIGIRNLSSSCLNGSVRHEKSFVNKSTFCTSRLVMLTHFGGTIRNVKMYGSQFEKITYNKKMIFEKKKLHIRSRTRFQVKVFIIYKCPRSYVRSLSRLYLV